MRQLWRTLRGHRTPFVVILVAEVTMSGLEALLHPLLLKALFDEAILTADPRRFLFLGLTYLALGLTLNLTGYWIACRRKRFENAFTLVLESELLGRALGLDGRKMARAGNASYVSRIHNDVSQGVLPAVDVSLRIARQAVTSVVFLGVLLYLSWQASLVLLVIVPPLVFVSNRLGRRIEENTGPEREAEARYINTLTRTLEAFPALRGLPSLLPGTRRANQDALRGFLGITFVNFRLAQRQRTLSDLVMNLSDTASMIVGAFFVFSGRMTFGSFLAFVNSLWRAVTGMFDLINMIPQARRSTAVLERIEFLRSPVRTRTTTRGRWYGSTEPVSCTAARTGSGTGTSAAGAAGPEWPGWPGWPGCRSTPSSCTPASTCCCAVPTAAGRPRCCTSSPGRSPPTPGRSPCRPGWRA